MSDCSFDFLFDCLAVVWLCFSDLSSNALTQVPIPRSTQFNLTALFNLQLYNTSIESIRFDDFSSLKATSTLYVRSYTSQNELDSDGLWYRSCGLYSLCCNAGDGIYSEHRFVVDRIALVDQVAVILHVPVRRYDNTLQRRRALFDCTACLVSDCANTCGSKGVCLGALTSPPRYACSCIPGFNTTEPGTPCGMHLSLAHLRSSNLPDVWYTTAITYHYLSPRNNPNHSTSLMCLYS